MDIFKELQEEGVDAALLEEIQRFRQAHPAPREAAERVPSHGISTMDGRFGRARRRLCCVGSICCWRDLRPRAKTSWRRTWQRCLAGRFGMCPCM